MPDTILSAKVTGNPPAFQVVKTFAELRKGLREGWLSRGVLARAGLRLRPTQCAQVWARKSGTLIGRDQAMMTLLRAGWAGAAAGAPRFAPTIAPPDRMLVGRGSGVAG